MQPNQRVALLLKPSFVEGAFAPEDRQFMTAFVATQAFEMHADERLRREKEAAPPLN